MRTFASIEELAGAVGTELGPGPWLPVGQSRVDAFADATGDHQWIHVDPARAADGPYGQTVAHGYLTLSLLPALVHDVYAVEGVAMGVNYGLNRVRFPAPVPADGRIRATVRLDSVDPVAGGVQLVATVTVTADGATKPCCVAESVTRLYAP